MLVFLDLGGLFFFFEEPQVDRVDFPVARHDAVLVVEFQILVEKSFLNIIVGGNISAVTAGLPFLVQNPFEPTVAIGVLAKILRVSNSDQVDVELNWPMLHPALEGSLVPFGANHWLG